VVSSQSCILPIKERTGSVAMVCAKAARAQALVRLARGLSLSWQPRLRAAPAPPRFETRSTLTGCETSQRGGIGSQAIFASSPWTALSRLDIGPTNKRLWLACSVVALAPERVFNGKLARCSSEAPKSIDSVGHHTARDTWWVKRVLTSVVGHRVWKATRRSPGLLSGRIPNFSRSIKVLERSGFDR